MYFWKYPEDERKSKPLEGESIALHDVFTKEVSLAPRDISSRMNTFMMEAYRPIQSGDREALNVHVVSLLIFSFPGNGMINHFSFPGSQAQRHHPPASLERRHQG